MAVDATSLHSAYIIRTVEQELNSTSTTSPPASPFICLRMLILLSFNVGFSFSCNAFFYFSILPSCGPVLFQSLSPLLFDRLLLLFSFDARVLFSLAVCLSYSMTACFFCSLLQSPLLSYSCSPSSPYLPSVQQYSTGVLHM